MVVAAIIQPGRPGALVIGHLLGDFELAAVAQIFRDASRAEGVATDLRLDAGVGRAPTDHAVHVGLAHRAASEDTRLAFGRGKEPGFRVHDRAFSIRRGTEGFHITVEIGL